MYDGIRGHRCLETIQPYSQNYRCYNGSDYDRGGFRSQETSCSSSLNCVTYNFGVDGRVETSYQKTIHSSSHNSGARFDVKVRGVYRSQTSHSSSRFSEGCDRFSVLSFTFRPVDENIYEDKIGGYSVHGYDKGDISCYDGYGRKNISRYDDDLRDDILVDGGRREYSSKDTRHFSSRNIVETFGGDCICGHRSQTSHSPYHNPGENVILLCISGASCNFYDSPHIPYLCFLHRPPSRLPSSVLTNLLPPEA